MNKVQGQIGLEEREVGVIEQGPKTNKLIGKQKNWRGLNKVQVQIKVEVRIREGIE